MKTKDIAGQRSWKFASDLVDAAVSQQGGQLAPVTFKLPRRAVTPYSIAPWAQEKARPEIPSMLQALRGDFFCAPFGGNDRAYRGERHPPHGESANSQWHYEGLQQESDSCTLHLSLSTEIRKGRIDKFLRLNEGQTAIYSRHVISGASGRMCLGHHAMLKFPEHPGSGRISTSRLQLGRVAPAFEDPAAGGYNSLRAGAKFTRLDRVKLATGETTDLSRYPARRGFEDLVQLVHQDGEDFAWTAVAFPGEGYVWFALKDPRVLQSTIFWLSNGGRHYPPWNSRHVGVMGLEEVTSYFHYGLAESGEPNALSKEGFATTVTLSPRKPTVVNYIMAVAAIPASFDRVKKIVPGHNCVTLVSDANDRIAVPLDVEFLYKKV